VLPREIGASGFPLAIKPSHSVIKYVPFMKKLAAQRENNFKFTPNYSHGALLYIKSGVLLTAKSPLFIIFLNFKPPQYCSDFVARC